MEMICSIGGFIQNSLGLLRIPLILIAIMVFPAALLAQTGTSGQIAGSVTDSNGAVVPAATITVVQIETGAKRTLTSSTDGNYSITNLPIGTYRLSVTKTGFKETSVSNVVVNVENITRQDVTLQAGEKNEVVNITADKNHIEAESRKGGA